MIEGADAGAQLYSAINTRAYGGCPGVHWNIIRAR
jgi:hypothetical protein